MRLLIVCLALAFATAASAQPSVRFEDYPAGPGYVGPPAEPVLNTPQLRQYRTRIRAAASLPANFAGDWRLETWGCGMECTMAVAVHLPSGRAMFVPGISTMNDHRFERDARLIAFTGILERGEAPAAHYFVLDRGDFRLLRSIPLHAELDQPSQRQQQAAASTTSAPLTFPFRDVEAQCDRLVTTRMIPKAECIRSEQRGYDLARRLWDRVDDKSKSECAKIADMVLFFYTKLDECLSMTLWIERRRFEQENPQAAPRFRY